MILFACILVVLLTFNVGVAVGFGLSAMLCANKTPQAPRAARNDFLGEPYPQAWE